MIFCIEDEESIRDLMIYTLNGAGFDAKGFSDGKGFFEALQQERPRLILLDIMLPGEDGISILKRLRSKEETAGIPVMMATAKGTEYDKVMGLDLGADDYLVKPFGMMEMISRIRAVLRRTEAGYKDKGKILQMGALELNPETYAVSADGERVQLTLKEHKLLRILMENPKRVFTRDQLLESVWGIEYAGETRTVDVHVRRLREKIESNPSEPKYIHTKWGVGYYFANKE